MQYICLLYVCSAYDVCAECICAVYMSVYTPYTCTRRISVYAIYVYISSIYTHTWGQGLFGLDGVVVVAQGACIYRGIYIELQTCIIECLLSAKMIYIAYMFCSIVHENI